MLEVLHIDDDDDIRDLVQLAFDIAGDVNVESAASGAEGMAALDAGYRPDLILLDVMMPGLDGLETAALIRERSDLKDIPVIFMTAQAVEDEQRRLLGAGARGVIVKPFDPMTLAQRVRSLAQ